MSSVLELVPVTSQKHDPAWKHCQMFKNEDKILLQCVYCGKYFKGGGIHRIKEHLAGQKGNASSCGRVPHEIRLHMRESLNGVVVKKRRKQKIALEITGMNTTDEIVPFSAHCDSTIGIHCLTDSNEVDQHSGLFLNPEKGILKKLAGRKKGRTRNISLPEAFDAFPITGVSKMSSHEVHVAIGRFLYDVGLSLTAVNSAYFQPMIDAIASQDMGVVAPSHGDLRGWILKHLVKEVKDDIERFMGTWEKTGCSLLAYEWSSKSGRTLINLYVYSFEGTIFLKSMDISEIKGSPEALFEVLKDAIEQIGVRNVLQVITSCDERYCIAGDRLVSVFPTLYWSPCGFQCIDLILDDFVKIEWINMVVEQAKSVTRYVYNNCTVLNMVRRYTLGNDLVEAGVTHYSTSFMSLKRILSLKHCLQGMITSQEWVDCLFSKSPGGLLLLDLISDQTFWSSIDMIIQLVDPLLLALRIVCNERKPGMGYVYAGIYRAKERIKRKLMKKKDYLVYWDIIDVRWGKQRRYPLHAAGFYLNPRFFYSIEGDVHNDIVTGLFDCIETLVPDTETQDNIVKEINSYKNASGDFGRNMAVRARDLLLPAEWWSTYGSSCPHLSRLAIRILSQTCSLIGHSQHHIPFDQMHAVTNCLERQRLNDIVSAQYNLRLKVRKSSCLESMDPTSSDMVCFLEDWICDSNLCLEDYGSPDWMTVEASICNSMLLRHSTYDPDELGNGFDDLEIFNGVRAGEQNR